MHRISEICWQKSQPGCMARYSPNRVSSSTCCFYEDVSAVAKGVLTKKHFMRILYPVYLVEITYVHVKELKWH